MTKPLTRTRKKPASPPSGTSWIARSIAALFGRPPKRRAGPAKPGLHGPPVAPTKAETALLEPFAGLPPKSIFVPRTKAELDAAAREIVAAGVAGFDTEAKPTFRAGEKSGGPHVVQFALTDKAFIFQLHRRDCPSVVAELIASNDVLKVGFGLKNDHGQIRNRLGVSPGAILDLDYVFHRKGYPRQIGVRAAIGAIFHQSFPKSKSTTTSNWAAPELTSRQLTYAANDAYAALKIMEALALTPEEISGAQAKEAAPKRAKPDRRRTRRPARSREAPSA